MEALTRFAVRRPITVLVLLSVEGEPPPSLPPVAGAKVLLIGSDTGSAGGIVGGFAARRRRMSEANGRAEARVS